MNDEEYKLYLALNERVTDLAKSYRVLNDSHLQQRLEFVELKTQVEMVASLVKWLVPPSALFSALLFIVKLLEMTGVI